MTMKANNIGLNGFCKFSYFIQQIKSNTKLGFFSCCFGMRRLLTTLSGLWCSGFAMSSASMANWPGTAGKISVFGNSRKEVPRQVFALRELRRILRSTFLFGALLCRGCLVRFSKFLKLLLNFLQLFIRAIL